MDEQHSETIVVVDGRAAAHRYWGLMAALGVVAIIFGIVVLANIWASVHLVSIFAGLFLAFAGLMQFVNVAGAEKKTGRIIAGVLFLVAGLALIFIPEQSGHAGEPYISRPTRPRTLHRRAGDGTSTWRIRSSS